jgi:hypothetical protein
MGRHDGVDIVHRQAEGAVAQHTADQVALNSFLSADLVAGRHQGTDGRMVEEQPEGAVDHPAILSAALPSSRYA